MPWLTLRALFVWLPLLAVFLLSYRLPFDQAVADWCFYNQSAATTNLSLLITDLGSPTVVLLLTGLVFARLLLLKQRRQAIFVILSVLGVSVLNEGIKQVVRHPSVQITPDLTPRTLVVRDMSLIIKTPSLPRKAYSYPSGHAAGSLALALAIITLSWPTRYRTTVTATCIVVAALIGATRVFIWAHYVSDVLGGWSLAAAWVALLYLIILKPKLGLERTAKL